MEICHAIQMENERDIDRDIQRDREIYSEIHIDLKTPLTDDRKIL